jgi:nitroreductase
MPLYDAMTTQRTVRRLRPELVDDAVVTKCIELALRAPTGSNGQNWEFVVVKDREVKAKLAARYRLRAGLPNSSGSPTGVPVPCASTTPTIAASTPATVAQCVGQSLEEDDGAALGPRFLTLGPVVGTSRSLVRESSVAYGQGAGRLSDRC